MAENERADDRSCSVSMYVWRLFDITDKTISNTGGKGRQTSRMTHATPNHVASTDSFLLCNVEISYTSHKMYLCVCL